MVLPAELPLGSKSPDLPSPRSRSSQRVVPAQVKPRRSCYQDRTFLTRCPIQKQKFLSASKVLRMEMAPGAMGWGWGQAPAGPIWDHRQKGWTCPCGVAGEPGWHRPFSR